MKTDVQLQRDVIDQLAWESSIEAAQVGVTAKDGVIALTGVVPRYLQKIEAEKIAKDVAGVKAIANDLVVRLPGTEQRTDAELAEAALVALKWHSAVPHDVIQVVVRDGHVHLQGEVQWNYQRNAAQEAIRSLTGVRGVTNEIRITPIATGPEISAKIKAAFTRSAAADAEHVRVSVNGGNVTLEGTVASWAERREAERSAWAAPGVVSVGNHLTVRA